MERRRFLRLTRTTMAIAQRDSSNVAIMLPEGASLEVLGPFDGDHLMDVRYEGEIIMMFTDAIDAHTEVIKTKTAGTS